jgi:hypothetical protein
MKRGIQQFLSYVVSDSVQLTMAVPTQGVIVHCLYSYYKEWQIHIKTKEKS